MTWIKRVGLSLASALAANGLVSFGVVSRLIHPPASPQDKLHLTLVIAAWQLIVVLPGWLLFVPVALCFNRLNGWRLWVQASIGTLLGPAIVAGFILFDHYPDSTRTMHFDSGTSRVLLEATAISLLSTLLYLNLIQQPRDILKNL